MNINQVIKNMKKAHRAFDHKKKMTFDPYKEDHSQLIEKKKEIEAVDRKRGIHV